MLVHTPQEILDRILLCSGTANLAIVLGNEYVKGKLLRRDSRPLLWHSSDDDALSWLMRYSIPGYTDETMYKLVHDNNLAAVQWLCERLHESQTTEALLDAAGLGHLDMVKWLHGQHKEMWKSSEPMDTAASCGHLAVLQWLHEQQECCTSMAMNDAAMGGYLDVIQWLHEHQYEGFTERTMNLAAAGGHLDMVRWLHENRQEGCTVHAMTWAAEHGHLDVVQWLHLHRQEGCTAVDAMDYAAFGGHFDVVQWLHENLQEDMDGALSVIHAFHDVRPALFFCKATGKKCLARNHAREPLPSCCFSLPKKSSIAFFYARAMTAMRSFLGLSKSS